jgi:DedD protein
VIAAKKESAEEKKPQAKPAEELAIAKPAPAPVVPAPPQPKRSSAKTETPPASAPAGTIAPAAENKPAEKPAGEQLALARQTPIEMVPENKALSRVPTHKALEGFIIQLAFQDKEKARNWAENMERRGYAVSITEAGTGGALRVRLGNFAVRDDAERQLRTFKQEGISGIIINLPQAFRPEARSSLP